ncbi:MAG TPA: PRC-barrel domain-containing protein [Phycisphaerales bacterium]|nr:PRC-barrel domain-containing protein [Phycisphaerales bacterium]
MERKRARALAPVMAMLLAAGAAAQTQTQPDRAPQPGQPAMNQPGHKPGQPRGPGHETDKMDKHLAGDMAKPMPLIKWSTINDVNITNAKGEDLGDITDMVVDLDRGRVAYVAISRGGVLGMGDKLFAVPWRALTPAPAQEKMYLAIDQARLENLSGFDQNNWPTMEDPAWAVNIHREFNTDPYWEVETRRTATAYRGWDDNKYLKDYDPARTERIQGTVVAVQKARPMADMDEGMIVTIKTNDGKTRTVHLGPSAYMTERQIVIRENDVIRIEGAAAKVENRDVVVASRVARDRDNWELRDRAGKAAWARHDRDDLNRNNDHVDRDDEDKDAKLAKFNLARVSQIVGADVKNTAGENLGEIQDVILQPRTGRLAYAVLGTGGVLGVGEDRIAVPFKAFTHAMDGNEHEFVLALDKERIKTAPKFGKDQDYSARDVGGQVHTFFGVEPYWVLDERELGMRSRGTEGRSEVIIKQDRDDVDLDDDDDLDDMDDDDDDDDHKKDMKDKDRDRR